MIHRSLIIGLLTVGLATSLYPASHAQTPPAPGAVAPAQVDGIFAKWNRPDSPGCALAVMQGGHIIYKRGYGMADLSHDTKITTTTPFHVASVSKQFAAAAIVLLAGQGKLSLDDDVHKYVPELPDFGALITIRHLLQHTSGLRDQWDLLSLSGFRYSLDLITDQDVMDLVVRQKELNFPPGSEYSYSNTGYTLAGQIVKRVTGESLREFTTNNIFKPLGMTRTHFRDDHAEINKGEALGYESVPSGAFRLSVTNFDTVGATSLYTTVEDLAKWEENFYSPKVGGADFARRMTRTDKLTSGKDNQYAMALILGNYRGLPIVEHSGGDAGYRSHLMRFPEQHFSVACLCNTVTNASGLARKVADLYLADRFTAPAPLAVSGGELVKLPHAKIAGKAGYFRGRNVDVLVRLEVDDGMLQLVSKDKKQPMRTDNRGNFLFPDTNNALRFEPAEGEASRLLLDSGGQLPEIWDRLPAFSPPPGAEQQFVGAYYSEELDATYRIGAAREKPGTLILKRKKYPDNELVPLGADLFGNGTASWMMTPIRFLRDAKGRISGMTLTTGRTRNLKFVRQAD